MIKYFLLGAFTLAQFSLVSAKETPSLPKSTTLSYNAFQQVPKTVIIKTKKFKIRIDKQPNGRYLYQSWNANAKITAKPSMIISDGELIPDGTGGIIILISLMKATAIRCGETILQILRKSTLYLGCN